MKKSPKSQEPGAKGQHHLSRLGGSSGYLVFVTWLLALSCHAADLPITPEGREFFENKIRPVLSAECNECHNAVKHKGGFRLDYRGGWQKGGDNGDDIVPGDASKSLLIKSIRHEDPDLKMPAKSPKLDAQVIADFEKWVNMGAPDPRDEPPKEVAGKPKWAELLAARRTWWSLQPVKKPEVPAVKDTAWSSNPVDRFLLAKMEEHDLTPAKDADPRTFIRRLTFAITGLPPTPGEVEAFVRECSVGGNGHETIGQSDHRTSTLGTDGAAKVSLSQSPIVSMATPQARKAIERLTDRLLASPHFGEHWARHWLDLVRYAETHGSEGDPEIREAWRYRDYMISALNQDVPVDQLIRENLAGDLLAHPRISTDGINQSMLGIAQYRLVEHGFQPVDTLDDEVKVVDNQIDVVSKAFQGLTVACARCHDHKFDAISQHDYYALFGIFASCRPAQITIDSPAVQTKNRDALEHLHAQIKSALADAWLKSGDQIASRLRDASAQAGKSRAVAAKIRDLEQQVADLEWSARQALSHHVASSAKAEKLPSPFAAWSFENGANDTFGHLNGHLEGGAEIRNGRLVLDGKGAYFRTDQLPMNLEAKTLEAWVSPATLDQRGGGVVSVESTDVHGFDAIVFAEREPRRWYPGSNFGLRSENVGGAEETAKPGELVHMALVYGADNRITMYRNGVPYGHSYAKGEMKKFEEGKARVLLGLRHKGAGSGFFAGEIEEARLYDRALTAEEVAASYHAGAGPVITPEQITAALSPEQRQQRTALTAQIDKLRAESKANPATEAWAQAMTDAATNASNPLHLWAKLENVRDADLPAAWQKLTDPLRAKLAAARQANQEQFKPVWNLAGADYAKWFPYGPGLTPKPLAAGEFAIEPRGDRILDGLKPGGAFTDRLSEKHTGILTSPRFKIESDSISVRAFGAGGAMVRVIVDNYPLPSNPIFPKAILEKSEPGWVRLDTAYRKGSYAYIEFATHEDLTRPLTDKKEKPNAHADEPSYFGVDQVVFHNGKSVPQEEDSVLAPLLDGPAPKSAAELVQAYSHAIAEAVQAWRHDQLTESQRLFLDGLVHRGVLPATLTELDTVRPLVTQYRELEAGVPQLHHAPGVLETVAYDAPFLPRGDHLKPGEPVPRRYLEVFGGQPYHTSLSGRRELADAIANPQNPLTARVMVNRIWHWLYGRGIVATVDNFGRLGEKPTHPELLDYLAARFVEHGWSVKDMIRYLVTTRAFAMDSEPSAKALAGDPSNDWLSHMRVHRIEAESIRDSLLVDAGVLDDKMFGKPADINSSRRSIYLPVRRTFLNPFLQVFDAPRPFTTLGRRDATNVPAQSLTMLNSPFVIEQAKRWSRMLVQDNSDCAATRINRMFVTAFARPADDRELAAATEYLNELVVDHKIRPDELLGSAPVWEDFAQSLFNLKEFIYLR